MASDLEASFGKGYRLRGLSLDIVANGYWPIDFGGVLGEPVTRGIEAKLPWLNTPGAAAAALQAAGLKTAEDFAPEARSRASKAPAKQKARIAARLSLARSRR